MKKTIFMGLLLLAAAGINHSFSRDRLDPPLKKSSENITTLIINADVVVVLVNGENTSVLLDGDDYFSESVQVYQRGKKLVINSKKYRDFKAHGIVYVPAAYLDCIMINSSASVKSAGTLQNPELNVTINGRCEVSFASIGEINLLETDYYTFVRTSDVNRQVTRETVKKEMAGSYKE